LTNSTTASGASLYTL